MNLSDKNLALIQAILDRSVRDCPGALAAIGVYGSVAAGDDTPRSDLDLLLLINDERGRVLSDTFILGTGEDRIGYDFYCTTWQDLERDAAFTHPHLGKLMDSELVWFSSPAVMIRLEALRDMVRAKCRNPLTKEGAENIQNCLTEAKKYLADLVTADALSAARLAAAVLADSLINAVMLANRAWFRRGTRFMKEELSALSLPEGFLPDLDTLAGTSDLTVLQETGLKIFRAVRTFTEEKTRDIPDTREAPSASNLRGSAEEMVSNWRGKMITSAGTGDRLTAFFSLAAFQGMRDEIACGVRVPAGDAFAVYDPEDLAGTAASYDRLVEEFTEACREAGLPLRCFEDTDAFLSAYLGKQTK